MWCGVVSCCQREKNVGGSNDIFFRRDCTARGSNGFSFLPSHQLKKRTCSRTEKVVLVVSISIVHANTSETYQTIIPLLPKNTNPACMQFSAGKKNSHTHDSGFPDLYHHNGIRHSTNSTWFLHMTAFTGFYKISFHARLITNARHTPRLERTAPRTVVLINSIWDPNLPPKQITTTDKNDDASDYKLDFPRKYDQSRWSIQQ